MVNFIVDWLSGQTGKAGVSDMRRFFLALLPIIMVTVMSAGAVFISADAAYAKVVPPGGGGGGGGQSCKDNSGNVCQCVSNLEPNLLNDANNGAAGSAGFDIINSIFSTINGIMGTMAEMFYKGIIAQPDYVNAVNALVVLYVTIYGILILFNLASARTGEVTGRLIKIGILWSIMSPTGWTFFSTYVAQPVLGTINDMIAAFSAASMGVPLQNVVDQNSGGNLSTASMQAMMGPMTLVFSTTFAVALIALASTPVGWFMALVIVWGLVEFLFMIIGATLTYVKSIVGLAFLFGLAPIFFAFILFDKTKQIFMGWVNQVMGFFLTPVLLFAFLGFYGVLLFSIISEMMFPTGVDYCYVTWFKIGIFDVHFWRPVSTDAGAHPGMNCANLCQNGGDWVGGPPVQIVDILYFLLLTHLGKNLSKFIEKIAQDISGGSGPGAVSKDAVGRWFSNTFAGGRGPGGMLRDFGGAAMFQGKQAAGKIGAAVQKAGGAKSMMKRAGLNARAGMAAAAGAVGGAGKVAGKVVSTAVRHPVLTSKLVAKTTVHTGQQIGKGTVQTVKNARKVADTIGETRDKVLDKASEGAQKMAHQAGRVVGKTIQAGKDFPQNFQRGVQMLKDAPDNIKAGVAQKWNDAGQKLGDLAAAAGQRKDELGANISAKATEARNMMEQAAIAIQSGALTDALAQKAAATAHQAVDMAGKGLNTAFDHTLGGHGLGGAAMATVHGVKDAAHAAERAAVYVHSGQALQDTLNLTRNAAGQALTNAEGLVHDIGNAASRLGEAWDNVDYTNRVKARIAQLDSSK